MKQISTVLLTFFCLILFNIPVYAQSSESLMSAGIQLLNNGAYDQAVSKFRKIISRNPDEFEAQYNLGLAYLNWRRYSQAAKAFLRATDLNSRSAEAWSNLAFAYEQLGQSDKSLDALYRAVESNPRNTEARINLAAIYAKKGRTDDAIKQYIRAIEIDGSNAEAYINLAECFSTQNRYKEAKHYLKEAIRADPGNATPCYELGNILWKNEKNAESALTYYRKAVVIQPNSQNFYENLCLLLEDQWKKKKDDKMRLEAIDLWKKSLIYLIDAYEKENIRERIVLLERGEAPSGKTTTEDLFGNRDDNNERVEKLRKEMRNSENEDTDSYKKITVNKYDVESVLADLESDTSSSFSFDIDEAVKRKAALNKQDE
ncbi:MAG: tetratricopeptide repeat protein [Chitinispirillia bacterium]|jgi:tetratricopeptide (TPR) repeat protein